VVGEAILQACVNYDRSRDTPRQQIMPGVYGRYRPFTPNPDTPNQLTVSANQKIINSSTGRPSKVGLHIDMYPPDTTAFLMNVGPDERWHIVAPAFNVETVPDAKVRPDRINYLAEYLSRMDNQADTIPPIVAYWLKIAAPTAAYFTAVVGTRIGEVLHEGSTFGCAEPSDMVACHIEPVAAGDWRSPLVLRENT
jgi:hypothetical protein